MQEGRKLVEELSRSSDEDRSSASSHFLTKDPPASFIHAAGLAGEALVVRDQLCRDSGLESSGPSVSAPLSLDAITPSQEPSVHNATLLPPSGTLSRSRKYSRKPDPAPKLLVTGATTELFSGGESVEIVEESPSSSSKVDGRSLLAGRREMTSLLRAFFISLNFRRKGAQQISRSSHGAKVGSRSDSLITHLS